MAAEINLPATSVPGAVPAPVQGPVMATPVTQRYRAPGARRPGPALWGLGAPSGRPPLRPCADRAGSSLHQRGGHPASPGQPRPSPRSLRPGHHYRCRTARSTATYSRGRQPQRTPAPTASWDGSQTRSGASSGRRGHTVPPCPPGRAGDGRTGGCAPASTGWSLRSSGPATGCGDSCCFTVSRPRRSRCWKPPAAAPVPGDTPRSGMA
jgi:hypothetical protein